MAERKRAKPRFPHSMTKEAENKMREGHMKEGSSLREADIMTGSAKRMAHGASPPFLPGDTGKGPRMENSKKTRTR